jgi:hypothetical protein
MAHRLLSCELSPPKIREYLSASEKQHLMGAQGKRCAVCQANLIEDKPQADHKIPLDRHGGNELENWQMLCRDCNAGKKAACKGCSLDCQECPWAFPEKGVPFVIKLDKDTHSKLNQLAGQRKETIKELIESLLKSLPSDEK